MRQFLISFRLRQLCVKPRKAVGSNYEFPYHHFDHVTGLDLRVGRYSEKLLLFCIHPIVYDMVLVLWTTYFGICHPNDCHQKFKSMICHQNFTYFEAKYATAL